MIMVRLVLCVFLGFSSLAGFCQQAARLESIRIIRDGDNFLRIGNWEYALDAYNRAVQTDPGYADAWMKRAALNQMVGRIKESRADYQQAVSLNPYSVYIYDQRAALGMLAGRPMRAFDGSTTDRSSLYQSDQHVDINILQGHYQTALEQLDSLSRAGLSPGYEHERTALVYLLMGDLVSANAHADSALVLSPGRALAMDLKGLAAMYSGDCAGALRYFNRAVETDPSFYLPYFNRACAHRCLGNREEAIRDLTTAIQESREMGMAYFARGMLRKEDGDTEGALRDYDRALASDSLFTSALFNRAFTFKMMGDFNQALSDANKIIELQPETPEHWNLKGNIHVLFGDYSEAVAAYDRALALRPEYGEALFNRGLAYLMTYALVNGCADLNASRDAGYPRAGEYLRLFCSP